MNVSTKINRHSGFRIRHSSWLTGALLGGGVGLAVALHSQMAPRYAAPQGYVFSGAPQGTDQLIYFSLVRAIWRSGNGFTYSYPFCLWWECPPVMIQLPLAIISWIARLTGIPAAFEIVRVFGAAICGATLFRISDFLDPIRSRRRWLRLALIFGGGFYALAGIVASVRVSGIDGLADWAPFVRSVGGQPYSWLPYVGQNVVYPLEMAYHALFFSALVALLSRRYGMAACLGAATWLSHPFTATALTATVLPWHFANAFGASREIRMRNFAYGIVWCAIAAAGCAYYGLFIRHWPALDDVARQHHDAFGKPMGPMDMMIMWGPWIVGLLWASGTSIGRGQVWAHPRWRLFAILSVAQICFLLHWNLLGDRAIQPFHFNRGYLHLGLVAIFWRMLAGMGISGARLARWLKALIALTVADQAVFFVTYAQSAERAGLFDEKIVALAATIPPEPSGQVVLIERVALQPYFAGCTPHVPFSLEDSMVTPFPEERKRVLERALQSGRRVSELGIRYALVQSSGPTSYALKEQGWSSLGQASGLVLMRSGEADATGR